MYFAGEWERGGGLSALGGEAGAEWALGFAIQKRYGHGQLCSAQSM